METQRGPLQFLGFLHLAFPSNLQADERGACTNIVGAGFALGRCKGLRKFESSGLKVSGFGFGV